MDIEQLQRLEREAAAEDRVSVPLHPNDIYSFVIVSNPEADMRKLARLRRRARWLRTIARGFGALAVVLGIPLAYASFSWVSHGRMPPADHLRGWAILAVLLLVGWMVWRAAAFVEHRRRVEASIDGVDRNRPVAF